MESNNQNTKRKMDKSIDKAASLTFAVEINEELRPNARLKDVRQAEQRRR